MGPAATANAGGLVGAGGAALSAGAGAVASAASALLSAASGSGDAAASGPSFSGPRPQFETGACPKRKVCYCNLIIFDNFLSQYHVPSAS